MVSTPLRADYPSTPHEPAKPCVAPNVHHLALVISDLGCGGAQRVLVQLAEAWMRAGRKVTVITLAGPEQDFFRLPAGMGRIALAGIGQSRSYLGALLANFDRVRRLRRALRDTEAQVAVAFIMSTAVLTILAALGLRIRVVACERNDPSRQSFGSVWSALRRLTYPLADVVTANSRGVLAALRSYVPADRLLYVANPLSAASRSQPARLNALTILSIGRLNRQKAHDVLLKAFAIFAAKHPDWRLAIMGDGPDAGKLRDLADELHIGDRVDWLGTQPDPYPWLQSAQMFVLASRHEGTPNALLEAMSCGLPCIVSDASPGPLELVADGSSGIVVSVDDDSALAAQMARLADDSTLARRLGEAARERVGADAALQSWEDAIQMALKFDAAHHG
jgi:glycosyltransferase involved in cell wall biosynthesis